MLVAVLSIRVSICNRGKLSFRLASSNLYNQCTCVFSHLLWHGNNIRNPIRVGYGSKQTGIQLLFHFIFRIISNFILRRAYRTKEAFQFDQNPVDNNLYIQSWHILIRPSKYFLEFLQQCYELISCVLGKI